MLTHIGLTQASPDGDHAGVKKVAGKGVQWVASKSTMYLLACNTKQN